MRFIVGYAALLLTACASSPIADNEPVDRACSVSECFNERDVRDFEVIDRTTLIVYVTGQRCAFEVNVDGTFCDLTFAPAIHFVSPTGRPNTSDRVCTNDIQIGVEGGPFTENVEQAQRPERLGAVNSACRVRGVKSLTDDQLIDLYVAHGVTSPPPPIGPGDIQVGEQQDKADEEGGAAAPASSQTSAGERPGEQSGEPGEQPGEQPGESLSESQ